MYPKEYKVELVCNNESCENLNNVIGNMYVKHRDEEDEEWFWNYWALCGSEEYLCPKCNTHAILSEVELINMGRE